MEFPGRRRPFSFVGTLLAIGVAGGVFFGAIAGNIGGFIAAGLFAVILVPVAQRALDSGPALVLDANGVNARAAGVSVPWADVSEIRHDSMPTPGTGARGFLIVGLNDGAEPKRSGLLAPGVRETKAGREVWISLTGIDANPGDIVDAARAERASAARP